jgi:hypothetical protein
LGISAHAPPAYSRVDENVAFLLCQGNAAFLANPETAVQPGQREPEGAAFADFAFDTDATTVGFDGQFAEGQSQASAESMVRVFDLAKLLKNTLVIFRRDAGTGIGDCDADLAAGSSDLVLPLEKITAAGASTSPSGA